MPQKDLKEKAREEVGRKISLIEEEVFDIEEEISRLQDRKDELERELYRLDKQYEEMTPDLVAKLEIDGHIITSDGYLLLNSDWPNVYQVRDNVSQSTIDLMIKLSKDTKPTERRLKVIPSKDGHSEWISLDTGHMLQKKHYFMLENKFGNFEMYLATPDQSFIVFVKDGNVLGLSTYAVA